MIIMMKQRQGKIDLVSVEKTTEAANGNIGLKSRVPYKFIMAEVELDGNKKKVIRIAGIPGKDVFHKDIFTRFAGEVHGTGAKVKPLYGGRIVIDDFLMVVVVGDRSLSYPAEPDWKEVAEVLRRGLAGKCSWYRILCRQGLDDFKDEYTAIIP